MHSIRPPAGHTARPFGRAPDRFALLAPELVARDDCTCDTNVYRPVCPSGCDNCVQRLVALPCGRSCPDNYCVAAHSSNSGVIGGAVGAVVGSIILAASGFLVYRTRMRRRRLAASQARLEARLRVAAAEKFRPGREAATAVEEPPLTPGEQGNSVGDADTQDASSVRTPLPGGPASGSNAALVSPEVDEETEYTELRPDGLTAYLHEDEANEEGDQLTALNPLNKRMSTSAATHLSRISERTELEEDIHSARSPSVRSRTTNRAPTWSRLPPIPGPAARNLVPSPLSRQDDPFGDDSSGTGKGAGADPAQGPSPTYLNVPEKNPHRLSTGTTDSALSATSGVPARVMRVQLQKPGKVELVRHGSGRKTQARSSSPTSSGAGFETAPESLLEQESEKEQEQVQEQIQEGRSVVSNPFEDPTGVMHIVVPPREHNGDPRATILSSSSSSSFAIPLIDMSKSVQRAHDGSGPSVSTTGPAAPPLNPVQEHTRHPSPVNEGD